MSFDEVLIALMAVFALLGGLDRILGGRFGLGQRFEDVVGGVPNLGTCLMKLPENARFLLPERLQGIYLPGYSVCFVHIVCG